MKFNWVISLEPYNQPSKTLCVNDKFKNDNEITDIREIRLFHTKKEAMFHARHMLGDESAFEFKRLISWRQSMRVSYKGRILDSELEMNYMIHLEENNMRFLYQDEYKKKPIKINLGRRKSYVPDFIVFDDEEKTITIVETKGYAKWSANEDNNIMDFMRNKIATDKDFLIEWLVELEIDTRGYDICYRRLKFLKGFGFVDYDFKNPNTIANQRKNKITELTAENKELKDKVKKYERYITYCLKDKLTKPQREWKYEFEKEFLCELKHE